MHRGGHFRKVLGEDVRQGVHAAEQPEIPSVVEEFGREVLEESNCGGDKEEMMISIYIS